jgi:outer membrane protein OmpA-like peptidoglycan-associated protein
MAGAFEPLARGGADREQAAPAPTIGLGKSLGRGWGFPLALLASLLMLVPVARAAEGDPLPTRPGDFTLKLEPGVSIPLTNPQSQLFDVGGSMTIKALWQLNRYLDLGPSVTYLGLPVREQAGEPGTAWTVGASLRLKRPHDEPGNAFHALSPWLDVDALYVRTGALNRPGLNVAIGLAAPIGASRVVWLGPFVRYSEIFQVDQAGLDNRDARLITVGLSLEVGSGVEREPVAVAEAPSYPAAPPSSVTNVCADGDGDGIPDVADRCPDVAGPWQNYGCPLYEKVVVQPDKLELKEKIQFAQNSPVIEAISYALLDEVAKALTDNKSFVVQVEGNASSEGGEEHNQTLSEQRAQAVLDYLADKGVARDRLKATGFSSSRPLVSNATATGRETNRRVEFAVHFRILNTKGSK